MDYELLAILLTTWIICLAYIYHSFEEFKNWKEQDYFMKLIMFHVTGVFIVFTFLLLLFFLNTIGLIGQVKQIVHLLMIQPAGSA